MRTRRSTEMWLFAAAVPVVLLLFVMLLVNGGAALEPQSFAVPALLVAAFVAAHVVERVFVPNADPALMPIAFMLAGLGICFVLRLTPEKAVNQAIFLAVGVVLMVATVVVCRNIEKISNYKYTCLVIGLVLLLLPVLPGIGREVNGSRIWVGLGSFSFQPGEIAKIFIVLFLAAYLASNRELLSIMHATRIGLKFPDFRTLLPLIVMWLVALVIVIFEKDLGSALLFFGVFLAMLYVCTGRLSYVLIALALVAVGAVGLYTLFSHVQTRVEIWLDPWADAQGSGYQLVQSLYSLADGGLTGVGIGRGQCTSIPYVENDFIFSAISEELGLLGACGVIILYVLFAIRGFLVAARAKSDYAGFLAVGLTTSICLQAFVIVGGVTGFIPLTGVTLPFVAQGGSSLISSFIIVGLLLCASNEATGHGAEMKTVAFRLGTGDSGVLGRAALGRRLTAGLGVFTVLFALLIANLTVVQVVRADEIQGMSGNNHTLAKESQRERGSIVTSDGMTLAKSVEGDDGTYTRTYPQGSLAAHAVGYFSQRYGTAGVEATESASLTGTEDFETIGDAVRAAAGIQNAGNSVKLTINSKIQEAAEEALSGSKGACVVLDTATGAVLAEASAPTFDLNDIESVLASDDSSGRLVNRTTQTLYAPGSSFKTVTLAAALDTGTVATTDTYESPASIEIGGGTVTNYHGASHGTISVARATEVSSNTVFAQIASELGANTLVSYAEAFGLNSDSLAQDFSLTTSLMPDAADMTEWETAWAGDGQPVGQHESSPAGPQVTPMQMAVTMAAIANDGVVMRPYLVQEVIAASGATVSTTSAQIFGQAMSASAAKKEQKVLKGVVESGSGTAAAVAGAKVMGKTGTAETSNAKSDAWFVGTAEAGGQSVTVAIVIERGDSGGEVAAPKASDVFYAALQELGGLE